MTIKGLAKVLAIPDIHHPVPHPKALEFILRIRDKYKPDVILSLGDFFDLASVSKYPMNPDLPGPSDEIDLAIESALPWYDEFSELQIVSSNHDARFMKKLLGSGLPSRIMKEFSEIMQSPPGWKWGDHEIIIDNVQYFHGEGLSHSSSKTAHNRFRRSVVHGHLHSAAHCSYSQGWGGRLFSLNAGCLIDARQKQFDYARNVHERAMLGCAIVTDGDEAVFWPMPDKMQRL